MLKLQTALPSSPSPSIDAAKPMQLCRTATQLDITTFLRRRHRRHLYQALHRPRSTRRLGWRGYAGCVPCAFCSILLVSAPIDVASGSSVPPRVLYFINRTLGKQKARIAHHSRSPHPSITSIHMAGLTRLSRLRVVYIQLPLPSSPSSLPEAGLSTATPNACEAPTYHLISEKKP